VNAAFSAETLRAARAEAAQSGRSALDVLEERSGLGAGELIRHLARALGYDAASMADLEQAQPAFEVLPYPDAARRGCAPLRGVDGSLALAFGDPFAADLRAWAEERIAEPFEWRLAHPADLAVYLSRHEEGLRAMDGMIGAAAAPGAGEAKAEDLSLVSISEDASPVVKLVNSTLYDAMRMGASDIHLESRPRELAIKYRVDGVLVQMGTLPGREQAEQIVSRLKVMSELDIAETRLPQDGRFKVTMRGREIDVRVSILPSIFGEDAVLRILDKEALADRILGLTLNQLGFDERCVGGLRRLSREPYGMLLVTGPTGSGKTTTLYAAISEINRGEDKIITIEDPIEYQLPGVLQIPVNEKKGLTFVRGLRSILRHDPDKIMVGEIRDPETADIAIQSALTGHLVFTTVHANNVIDVLGRFLNMKIEPYNFVSALNCVQAQRLVRTLCDHCKRPATAAKELLELSGLDPKAYAATPFYEAVGCLECGGTGYKGRTAICELLDVTDNIRELILARRSSAEIKRAAREEGMIFLRESAVNRALLGVTTLHEINKVTFVEVM
jgi:general secretion pathway protein E